MGKNDNIILPMLSLMKAIKKSDAVKEMLDFIIDWWVQGFYALNFKTQVCTVHIFLMCMIIGKLHCDFREFCTQ